MRKKVLKSLMLTLVSVSMAATGTGVTTFAAEIEEFSDSLDIETEEVDGEIPATSDTAEADWETENTKEPEIEVQDLDEESEAAEVGDGFELDVFSDGETATEEELPESGETNSFVMEGTVLKKYTGTDRNITIPANVTEIDSYAFAQCIGLRSVVCNQKLGTIGQSAFEGCIGLKTVTFNQGLKTIGESAFDGCKSIKSITIPDSVTLIEDSAFDCCSALDTVILQDGLQKIGAYAFRESNLSSITIPGSVTSVGRGAFAGSENLVSASVPGSAGKIMESCFENCQNLTSITLGSGITEIGICAFQDCFSLGTITLPASVTNIGDCAFMNCENLKTSIPTKIEKIGGAAFEGCKALTAVSFPDTLTTIDNYAFGSTGLTSVTVPASVTAIGINAFEKCENLTSAAVYTSVVSESCFEECGSLQTVTIGSGVLNIESSAFFNCTSLTKVSIANTVTAIGDEAFKNCSELTIYGAAGSFAEDYAAENDIPFVNNTVVQPLTVTLSASPSGSAMSGSQVKLTAGASGGSESFSYRFWISDANNQNWYKLRDYGKSNTYTWTTGIAGKKHLYVDVKDSSGTVKRAGITFEVKSKALTASLSVSPSGSAVSGSQVKLTAGASGGSGNYTYKFLICDAKGNWYKLQDFGKSNTYTWIPGATGKKTLYVDVRDGKGTVKRTSVSYEVKTKVVLSVTFTASPSGSASRGSKVTLTAKAGGGSGKYTYKFLICDDRGNWYKLRDYSSDNAYIWTTGATGNKTLYVDVRDSGGTVKREALSFRVR